MEFNESTYNLFDDYLSGNLSEGDAHEFEKSLSGNDSLREEFSFVSSAANAIQMSGNNIFKKQLAEIAAGISPSAFEKYSPSLKPKSFLKKYWWAISVAAAGIIALGLWFVFHPKKNSQMEDSNGTRILDSVKPIDSTNKKGTIFLKDDSCSDSVGSPIFGGEKPAGESPGGNKLPDEVHNNIQNISRTFMMPLWGGAYSNSFFDADVAASLKRNRIATAGWNSLASFNVEFCPQKNNPPFYSYEDHLIICGSYADSTNITFYDGPVGSNCLVMTDGKPGYFKLTKGAHEKELIRQNPKSQSINIPVDLKDTVIRVEPGDK
jgi:hypothetical protein